MMLPWIAVPLGAAGVFMALRGDATGWWLAAIAVVLLIIDVLIDLAWARRARTRSDQPLLNRREAQIVGRTVRVVEAIVGGEGKVRVGDTVWRARGPDCGAGTWVQVVAADKGYLVVSAAHGPDNSTPGT